MYCPLLAASKDRNNIPSNIPLYWKCIWSTKSRPAFNIIIENEAIFLKPSVVLEDDEEEEEEEEEVVLEADSSTEFEVKKVQSNRPC